MFITFEGIEGSGKSTLITLLERELSKRGCDVATTREPGGTSKAEEIRKILLKKSEKNEIFPPEAELFLFLAARVFNVSLQIKPLLEQGYVVLCDRFSDSTVAYQAFGRGLELNFVNSVCSFASLGLKPDVTFLLDIPPEVGLKRSLRQDRIEQESLEFFKRVRAGYMKLAADEPSRFVILDAKLSPESLLEAVKRSLEQRGLSCLKG